MLALYSRLYARVRVCASARARAKHRPGSRGWGEREHRPGSMGRFPNEYPLAEHRPGAMSKDQHKE